MAETHRNLSEEKKEERKRNTWFEIGLYCLTVIAVVFLVPRYVAERVVVEGRSMEPTLYDSESVFSQKITPRFGTLKRFDIVVFDPPQRMADEDYYIKRIIGLPGEQIQIVDGMIYIDGNLLDEHYGKLDKISNAGRACDPILLGEDEYFVLGDNREISKDSRSEMVGNVKRASIAGKVMFRIWPIKRFGSLS